MCLHISMTAQRQFVCNVNVMKEMAQHRVIMVCLVHSRQELRRSTISDYTNVNVCSKGVSTIMRCSHQDAAGSNKWVIHKVTLLDLQ